MMHTDSDYIQYTHTHIYIIHMHTHRNEYGHKRRRRVQKHIGRSTSSTLVKALVNLRKGPLTKPRGHILVLHLQMLIMCLRRSLCCTIWRETRTIWREIAVAVLRMRQTRVRADIWRAIVGMILCIGVVRRVCTPAIWLIPAK